MSVRLRLTVSAAYPVIITAMVQHQESFGRVLVEVYEPIAGAKFPNASTTLAAPGPGSGARKQRPITPERSMQMATAFHEASENLVRTLVPQLDDLLERQIISPTADYVALHALLTKLFVKRDHKKIDYDRTMDVYKKLKEKMQRDSEDERKMVKVSPSAHAP